MEPIDYRYALVRRWWLLPILAVICAVIAVLVPVSGKSARSQFEATAIIGIPPGGKNSTGGAAVSPQEVLFYAANEQVITSAAKSIGLKKTANLQGLVSVATPKSSGKAAKGASLLPPGSLSVSVKQPTAVRSAKLTNAYVNSLFTYINSQLAANQTAQGQADIQQANNIETQLNTVDAQIATTNCGTASTTSYTGSGQAASLLASFASFQVGTTGAPPAVLVSAGPASSAPSPSDSSPPSDNSPAKTAPPTTTTTGATTTTTSPTTTTTDPSPTTTTQPQKKNATCPALTALDAQRTNLQNEYNQAVSKVTKLEQTGPPQSGLVFLSAAYPQEAKKTKSSSNLLARRSVRGLVGLGVGLVLAVGLCFLLVALDKRMRKSSRVQETFGFPVIVEIPTQLAAQRRSPDYVVETIIANEVDPLSKRAEAYRGLRTAILLEPLAAERARRQAVATAAASPVAGVPVPANMGPRSAVLPTAPANRVAEVPPPEHLEPAERKVIMVVSPTTEPSRSSLVANIASTYAEAGESAMVVTTASLRDLDRTEVPVTPRSSSDVIETGDLRSMARPTHIRGVTTLGLGWVIDGPGHLATRAPAVMEAARNTADVVIVETNVLINHDFETLAPLVDVVVVVSEYGLTRSDEATRSGGLLRRFDAPVLGIAFTEVPQKRKRRLGSSSAASDDSQMTPRRVARSVRRNQTAEEGSRRAPRSRQAPEPVTESPGVWSANAGDEPTDPGSPTWIGTATVGSQSSPGETSASRRKARREARKAGRPISD